MDVYLALFAISISIAVACHGITVLGAFIRIRNLEHRANEAERRLDEIRKGGP